MFRKAFGNPVLIIKVPELALQMLGVSTLPHAHGVQSGVGVDGTV